MEQVSAFVLVGGKSSRMGHDKAELSLHGRTLLALANDLARSVTDHVHLVGPRDKYGAEAIADVYPGCGPLAGIHAALTNTSADLNFVLSVDTPFVTPEFLRFLVTEAARAATTVTVPFTSGRFQPLCAIYRRDFLSLAEAALATGKNKIDPLFCHTSIRRIDAAELIRLAFDPRMFDNLNTPEDFERAQNRR